MKFDNSAPRKAARTHSHDWSHYWKYGALTTFFGGEFERGYSGEVGKFWESCFESLQPESVIIDLATGNGAVPLIAARTNRRLQRDFRIIGLDYADIQLPNDEAIRQDMAGVTLLANTPMEATGLDDSSADLVVSHFGFEYGDQFETLEEVMRVLKPGGGLALVLHHSGSVVVKQAERDVRHTEICLKEEKLDEKVKRLVEIVGDARTPEERSKLKFNEVAEKQRAEINQTMMRILNRIEGEDDAHIHQVAQSFLRVFADLSHKTKKEKLDFIAQSSSEFAAYAGRMNSMAAATMSEAAFRQLIDRLGRLGFSATSAGALKSTDGQLVGRTLRASR